MSTHKFILILFWFPEVIDKYKTKIRGLDKDMKEILKQESEEKEVLLIYFYSNVKNFREMRL